MLTATCLSYGSLCDFLTFFRNTPGGQAPQPIFTQNGSNDVDSRIDVPFALKVDNFCTPYGPSHQAPRSSKFYKFLDLENLPRISRVTLEVSGVNTPYSASDPNKSVIVNRQCVGGKLKHVPKFCIGGTGRVISSMRNDDLHWSGTLEPNM